MANILIVDDEVDMLKLIKRVLEKDNHYVTLINHSKDIFHIDFRRYDLQIGRASCRERVSS